MLLLIAFDLPTDTKEQRKNYRIFKKHLLEDNAFMPIQKSFFYRWCNSGEKAENLKTEIQSACPKEGNIFFLLVPQNVASKAELITDSIKNNTFLQMDPICLI